MTRPREQIEQALRLHEDGFNDCDISRLLGIPRATFRYWYGPLVRERSLARLGSLQAQCQRCAGNEDALSVDYVYLLGLYLGDGCLSGNAKGVWRLRIFQDQRYRGLIEECRLAMAAVTRTRVAVTNCAGCVEIGASWKHWTHLFPQHGTRPKWLRPIVMEPWRQALIEAHPAQLVRGLIHSDGCRFMNPVTSRWHGGVRRYSYTRYSFSNNSDDIRRLFTHACERLDIHWTQTRKYTVAVSRRDDVALLDTFIDPKY